MSTTKSKCCLNSLSPRSPPFHRKSMSFPSFDINGRRCVCVLTIGALSPSQDEQSFQPDCHSEHRPGRRVHLPEPERGRHPRFGPVLPGRIEETLHVRRSSSGLQGRRIDLLAAEQRRPGRPGPGEPRRGRPERQLVLGTQRADENFQSHKTCNS